VHHMVVASGDSDPKVVDNGRVLAQYGGRESAWNALRVWTLGGAFQLLILPALMHQLISCPSLTSSSY